MKDKFIDKFMEATSLKLPKLPESVIVDYEDLPTRVKWGVYAFFYGGFIAIGIYFFVQNYSSSTASTFISLDNTSGICSQVSRDVTGDFLVDSSGNYDSSPNFQYENSIYSLDLIGLHFNDSQWFTSFTNVKKALTDVGKKGVQRDLAWNLVVWGSFDVVDNQFGIMEFYMDSEVNVILDKPINAVNFGSAATAHVPPGQGQNVTYGMIYVT